MWMCALLIHMEGGKLKKGVCVVWVWVWVWIRVWVSVCRCVDYLCWL